MLPIQIGNWIITQAGIRHINSPDPNYIITVNRLNESGPQGRDKMYDWLVHLPAKTWVSTEDVYSLNTALIFALEHFGIGFSPDRSFVDTFVEQQKEMRDK